MEKTIRELHAMTREELYAEAVVMHGKIRILKKELAHLKGSLELAERPSETVNH